MGKVKFEFDTSDDAHDIDLCNNRYKMAVMLGEIDNYIRHLNKYEERSMLPTTEVAEKLNEIISDWHIISGY